MDTPIKELFEEYKTGLSDRREFLGNLAAITGSFASALALLPSFGTEMEDIADFKDYNGDLADGFITYPGVSGEIRAYLARPKMKKRYPAVVVIHENRGLQPHIIDVNRRMAREGFISIAPDALSPLGGTPENDTAKAVSMIKQLDSGATVSNLVAAVKYLETHPNSTGKVGCTGFCWGGAMTNQVAVNTPGLKAAVPYYGRQPAPEDVPKIKAAVMAHYAENDQGINQGIAAFEEALKKAGTDYQIYMYPGTQHAFNNDTNKERYNEEAAKLAWKRTVSFFRDNLK